MTDKQQEPHPPVDNEHVAPGCEQFSAETVALNRGAGRSQLDLIRDAATRYERCCDLWQDSLGTMHCTECAQKTFAMLREIQELLGVGKDCQLAG